MSKRSQHALQVAAAAAIACLLSGLVARAQQDSCPRRTALVSAFDERGELLDGLGIESFKGEYRNMPVQLLSVRRVEVIPRIIVILDSSGSMFGAVQKWTMARKVAGEIVNYGPKTNQIGLVVFASSVWKRVSLAEGREAVVEALNSMPKEAKDLAGRSGRTALLDAILEGQRMLDPPRAGDVLYVITDGGDSASRAKPGMVEQELLKGGIRLFVGFLFESQMEAAGYGSGARPARFQEMALATGGNWFFIPATSRGFRTTFAMTEKEREELRAGLWRLHRLMTETYLIEIELPATVDKPRKWELQLKTRPPGTKGIVRLAYPRKLMPCVATPTAAQPK